MIIENIQKLCTDRKIRWSAHSLARIQERGLSRNDVIDCILSGEIIEDYPEDSPHPSCLILGYADSSKAVHSVVGTDGEYIYIITAYIPNTNKFEKDLKTRKRG